MKYRSVIIVLLVVSACCSIPAMGATKYFGGSPQMAAYVSGLNEFAPGDDAIISITLQNSGVTEIKFTNSGTLQPDDLPTTAKQVNVGLSSGDAPIIIKSDPQVIGDLASPGTKTVQIHAKILSNATIGQYQIPLTLKYKYLKVQDQEYSNILQFLYNDVTDTIPLTINIKPHVKIAVLSVVPENLNVGTEGYLNLTIKNIGSEDGKKATVTITRNDNSLIIPTDASVFVGDFPLNGVITCHYKVAASNNAGSQTYPVDVSVTYENTDGDVVTSSPVTVGVPVGGKISFTTISSAGSIYPGQTTVIEVVYENTGTNTAYNAQARLNAVEPFTSTDNGAYLGTLKPGEQATARYAIQADNQAVVKNYTLDTEIRYRDALDNSQISDMFKTPVQVVAKPQSASVMQVLLVAILIVAVLIGAGYYLLVVRKKK
ncbi:MAG: S-layer protein [Methanoregula sp.]